MQVYLIQNTANGKVYVGQHSGEDLDWYLLENVKSALRGSTGKRLLYRAFRKYGSESFTIRCIHKCVDKAEMDKAEKTYIKLFGTQDPELGYNLTAGGGGMLGFKFSEEAVEDNRKRGLLRGISEFCRKAQKEYLANRVFTEEHRKKLSESRKGMKFSEEHKRKLSESKKKLFASRKAAQAEA